MSLLQLADFRGTLPSVNDRLLDPRNATFIKNAVPEFGELRPLRRMTSSAAIQHANAVTLYKYNSNWFSWESDVNVVGAVVANDAYDRVYFTGIDYPRVTDSAIATTGGGPYPTASYRLGIPAPSAAPTTTVNGTGAGSPESRFYVTTFVDGYGAEGPPSSPSTETTVETNQTVTVDLPADPGAPYNVATVNVYRTNTTADGAVFQFVGSAAVGTATLLDNVLSGDLGEPLPSETWIEPPSDMVGLVSLPNGILAGFRSNEVLFSEPGLPHAWPTAYRMAMDYPIVGLAVIGSALMVLTEGQSYIVTGSTPASMVSTSLRTVYSCESKRGIVSFGQYVVYPSRSGLVIADGTEARLLTEEMISKKDWEGFVPSAMAGWRWGERVIVSYPAEAQNGMLVMDPRQPELGFMRFDDLAFSTAYFERSEETLYLATGNSVGAWDTGTNITQTWQSKPFTVERPTQMTVMQVWADAYPVVVEVYRDGFLQARVAADDNNPTRIPGGELGEEYQVKLIATDTVREVQLASSMKELKQA